MSKIPLSDGRWFETETAESWDEHTWWDGNNHISAATGSQWNHERLYRTAAGAWVLNRWSQYQGVEDTHEVLEADVAVDWLINNEHFDIDVVQVVLASREV